MTFFTDECVAKRANRVLEAFDPEHEIRGLRDCFSPGTKDVLWITAVAEWNPKPAVISGDARILKNRVEREVLRNAKLMWICLSDGWVNMEWAVYAWKLIKAWPGVVENVKRASQPTVFELSGATLKVEKRFSL
jgi:hypothetical protein